jgi:hypothetical protein
MLLVYEFHVILNGRRCELMKKEKHLLAIESNILAADCKGVIQRFRFKHKDKQLTNQLGLLLLMKFI